MGFVDFPTKEKRRIKKFLKEYNYKKIYILKNQKDIENFLKSF